ncbi:MAG TPA: helix-turn-helix transcriptional regulator [Baekduia sp.]|nr:helix-turn-helix transcriptional regulator [Baekduia sp.]
MDGAETPELLDQRADAAHFGARHAEAIVLKERAFAAYRAAGRQPEAAAAARWLAFLHGAVRGNRAAAGGWMARAERLLEGAEETVEHGRLALDRAPWTDDPAERERHARAALRIARRFGDRDLEFSAQAVLGHAYVVTGRTAEGMALIDEAMAAVAGGEVADVVSIGEIYCRLLGACERATDVTRAEQWIDAARRFVAWGDFVVPTCRLHYGGVLMAAGRWDEAEAELLAAARAFDDGLRGMRAAPLVRLAALRVRQGRFEEAERLLEGFEARPPARAVLAEVALARGDAALAEDLAGLCLGAQAAPDGVPAAELVVRARLARRDVAGARKALERLTALAGAAGGARAAATVALAEGRVLAAEGAPQARERLQGALDAFTELQLPLEAAAAQLALARLVAPVAPAGAAAEARAALAAFERLGAAHEADAAAAFLRTLGVKAARTGPRAGGELTRREREVLALLALGLSNPEIADRLFLSRKTVQHHVAHVLAKLGVRTRTEAAAWATRERATR